MSFDNRDRSQKRVLHVACVDIGAFLGVPRFLMFVTSADKFISAVLSEGDVSVYVSVYLSVCACEPLKLSIEVLQYVKLFWTRLIWRSRVT